jgi:hypothetical protein
MTWHLAQLNIGRLRAPPEDPATGDFMANLDPINALAEATPGFVWRLQTDEGNATAIRAFDGDPLMILNLKSHGPTGEAFTFRQPFPHPGGPIPSGACLPISSSFAAWPPPTTVSP